MNKLYLTALKAFPGLVRTLLQCIIDKNLRTYVFSAPDVEFLAQWGQVNGRVLMILCRTLGPQTWRPYHSGHSDFS